MANPEVVNYQLDFGLALTKAGINPGFRFIAMQVHTNFFAKVQDGMYTTTTAIPDEGRGMIGSFDFDEKLYRKLLNIIGGEKSKLIEQSLSRQPYQLILKTEEFHFGLVADLQGEVINNAEESYMPFKVIDFMPYSGIP